MNESKFEKLQTFIQIRVWVWEGKEENKFGGKNLKPGLV